MIAINDLSFYFGGRAIYENVNLHIKPKDRLGLIGANGTGKSTLLRLINEEYLPDSGSISKSNDCTIGFLNQDLLSYQSEDSILEVAKEAFQEQNALQSDINELIKELESNYSEDLVYTLSEKQERFETLGGYSIEAQSEEVLEGLGFSTADLQKPLKEFSGGWRMRVMLAKLLLEKPSLLMLDEPTNHLDLPSIQWVENYIQNYEGAIILVSHDRRFMERTAKIIVEVAHQQLHYYGGDYAFYESEKVLRKEIQQAAYENQQQKIKQTERFIERFRSKATKARQVQSRVKALERMDKVEEVNEEKVSVNFQFNFGQVSGKQVLKLDKLSKAYGPNKILHNSEATLMRGDKIALIGANGKGKSTLLRILANTESFEGNREIGHNVNYAFFAQHQLESLNVQNEMLAELQQAGSGKTDTELRGILGCFLFGEDDVFKKVKVLSGGEKSRVALAKVLISEANFLLLDEPTNHLDIQSVNILTQALNQYQGTYVLVSHDRHFLSQVANKIWYIEDQKIKEYPGTYDEFDDWYARNKEESKPQKKEEKSKIKTKKTSKPVLDLEKQKKIQKLQRLIREVETHITSLEKQEAKLEQEMAKPEVFSNPSKLEDVQTKYQKNKASLEKAQEEWESKMMNLEQLEG